MICQQLNFTLITLDHAEQALLFFDFSTEDPSSLARVTHHEQKRGFRGGEYRL